MNIIEHVEGDRVWAVNVTDDAPPEVVEHVKRRLKQEAAHFKDQQRVAKLSVDHYQDELYRSIVDKCPHCGSLDTVERRNRVMPFQCLGRIGQLVNGLWHVEPYRRCNACGNDFEIQDFDEDFLRDLAERRHRQAVEAVSMVGA